MSRVFCLLFAWCCAFTGVAHALPMYAQRSGRTCANCHVSPTLESEDGWEDPRLADRKCNLSCVACHVDPAGGGLRNASGRYYGQSTLSVLHTQDRSYSDLGREIVSDDMLWRVQQFLGDDVTGGGDGVRTIPANEAEWLSGMGAGQTGPLLAIGKPLGTPSRMAYWDGRYDDLNADPALNFGGDVRLAWWGGTDTFFPMQVDLHTSIHPVEHLSVVGTMAGRGRTGGPVDTMTDPDGPVFMRRAFVMAHELPGMAWAKAGVFQPAYGTHLDDHTSFTRAWFEQDVSVSDDTVVGVEVGAAPNYPFLTASVFQNNAAMINGGEWDNGWGTAVTGGWRDLGWGLTGNLLMKNRGGQGRGDLAAAAIGASLNPPYWLPGLPITWMGELSVGRRQWGDVQQRHVAGMHEAWFTPWNGVSLRLKHDVGRLDIDRPEVWQQRVSGGLELSAMPGYTWTLLMRALYAPSLVGTDAMVQFHAWF